MTRVFALLPLLAACASTKGARPHDMSVAGHETAATTEDEAATQHRAQYDPSAARPVERCVAGGVSVRLYPNTPCWTAFRNPTDEHRREWADHRKAAADHRAAAQVLRDAEARACGGISDEDRDESPFERSEDIDSAAPLYRRVSAGKASIQALAGAVVVVRPVPGLTAERLQRIVDCHLARNAALGHVVPEMPSCPLVPNGVTAQVVSTGDGFAVEIRSDDSTTTQEIWRRAQGLGPTRPSP